MNKEGAAYRVLDFADEAAWKKGRLQGIGGSDAAAIVGASPYKTNVRLFEELTGRRTPEDESNPNYDRAKAGIIVADQNGAATYRDGTMKMPGEEVIGGWAEVWRKDREHSTRIEVSFEEYVGRKKDGSVNAQWGRRPATMIRKVALVQALREAFPTSLGGMYSAEEQGQSEEDFNIIQVPNGILEEGLSQTQKTAALPQEAQTGFGNDSFFDE